VDHRECTKCHELLAPSEYYTLGPNRLDSWCKSCKKTKRKEKYISSRTRDGFNILLKMTDIIFDSELQVLSQQQKKLQELIAKCELRTMQ
jgi:hypothetical protein